MFVIRKTIDDYEEAIQSHPHSVSQCYFEGLSQFLTGVTQNYADNPNCLLEGYVDNPERSRPTTW